MTQNKDLLQKALDQSTVNTLDEAKGAKPLPPADKYPNCRVEIGELVENEKFPWPDGSPKVQAKTRFVCPTSDVDLSTYLSISKGKKSTMRALMLAVFGSEEAMVGKNIMDCNGAVVNVFVTHEPKPNGGGVYAAYKFTPADGKKKG